MKIYVTGRQYESIGEYEKITRAYADLGVTGIRINCTRFSIDEYVEICNVYRQQYEKTGKNVELILDIPWPGEKNRLTFYGRSSFAINKGTVYTITSSMDTPNSEMLYVDTNELLNKVEVGDRLIVGDGNLSVTVIDKHSDSIAVCADNSWRIPYRKAITKQGMVYSKKYAEINTIKWADAINRIKPDKVVLSFGECTEEILRMKKNLIFPEFVELIPKIETKVGVKNIEAMSKYANSFMVGRGDLALDAMNEIGKLTEEAVAKCIDMNRNVIVATGVMDSLGTGVAMPTRSELADVYYLKRMGVTGIVAGAPISQNIEALGRFISIERSVEV